MALPLRRRILSWFAIVLVAVCAAVFTWLALSTVIDKKASLWGQAFMLMIGLGGVVATLVAGKSTPGRGMPLRAWLAPKPIAGLFLAIVAGFGTMSATLPLFEPRLVVESKAGAIESKIDRLLPQTGSDARVAQKIAGAWGEAGCAVTYRFALKEKALVVNAEKRPAGAPPWRLVASVTGAKGDVLDAVGEAPAEAKGKAVTFTYVFNGAIERLTWDDQSGSVPLELDRC